MVIECEFLTNVEQYNGINQIRRKNADLFLGNGFDVRSDLPTKYDDFLHGVSASQYLHGRNYVWNYILEYTNKHKRYLNRNRIIEKYSREKSISK